MNVLIVGDIILDTYIFSEVSKLSQEASVPLIKGLNTTYELGGAAKLAQIISDNTTIDITLFGLVGENSKTKQALIPLLKYHKIDTNYLIKEDRRQTTEKIRFIEHKTNKQLFRFDNEDTYDLLNTSYDKIKKHLKTNKFDLILISDYEKGMLSEDLINLLITTGLKNNTPIIVDPKDKNIKAYKNVNIVKMNEQELNNLVGQRKHKMQKAIELLECDHLIVTNGEKATQIISQSNTSSEYTTEISYVNTKVIKSCNTVGAGDAFMAGLVINQALNIIERVQQTHKFVYKYLNTRTNKLHIH